MDPSQMVCINGNIRQQYLPFVLKPGSNLNANVTDDNDLKDGPQFFSFRNKNADNYKAGFGRLNICPSVINSPEFQLLFNHDIANRLLYAYTSMSPITINHIFNQLPGVQIREFQVDAALDQFINLFFELFQSAKGLFKEFKLSDVVPGLGNSAARDRWFKMIKEVLETAWNYCTAHGPYEGGPNIFINSKGENRWKNIGKSAADAAVDFLMQGAAVMAAKGAIKAINGIDLDAYLLDFPFTMYYRLQSCTTLNVYELPYLEDMTWSSHGKEGWTNAAMALKSLAGGDDKGSMAGKILSMVTGYGDFIDRVRIHYMPRWDPTGNGTVEQVKVSFDLFNDTADAAMKNFIFVNTIIPNNLWMQYGMLRHSPCLYDIKIEGHKRLFLCSGEFSVKGTGLARTPPMSWIRTLCNKYANQGASGDKTAGCWDPQRLFEDIVNNKLVKIPDVYTVEMTFESLIPQNFNNFLYNYSKNSKMEMYVNKPSHQSSAVGNVLKNIKTELNDEINKVMDVGNRDIARIRAEEERNKKGDGGGNNVNK